MNLEQALQIFRYGVWQPAQFFDIARIVDEKIERVGVLCQHPTDLVFHAGARNIPDDGMARGCPDRTQLFSDGRTAHKWKHIPAAFGVHPEQCASESPAGSG